MTAEYFDGIATRAEQRAATYRELGMPGSEQVARAEVTEETTGSVLTATRCMSRA